MWPQAVRTKIPKTLDMESLWSVFAATISISQSEFVRVTSRGLKSIGLHSSIEALAPVVEADHITTKLLLRNGRTV